MTAAILVMEISLLKKGNFQREKKLFATIRYHPRILRGKKVYGHKHAISIKMNVSTSKDSFDNSSRSVFFCPSSPHLIWDLKQTISRQLAIAVTAAASPFTILLNILVIVAVKKRRELQKNSNILIASLAVADLLVGAVSMPLSISVDALILRGTVSEDIICRISNITGFVLYTAYSVSLHHLILIAWERYVAIVKCMEYQVIVTKGRVKRYAGIAWITALVTTALYAALVATGIRYEILLVLNVILRLSWLISIAMFAYFYGMVYIEIRKENRNQVSQVSALIKAGIDLSKIAYTAFLLTVAVFISSVPAVLVYIVTAFSPVFRENAVFRWAEAFLQINSLVNPALYFYRRNRYRKAALKLLRFGKPREIEPVVRMGRRIRRQRDSFASIDVGKLIDSKRATKPCLRLSREQSDGAETHRHRVMDRRMSAPSLTRPVNFRDAAQPVTASMQIEHAIRKKPVKRETKLSNDQNSGSTSHRGKMTRSKSLNENAFAVATSTRQNIAKVNSQKRNSAPSVLAIESAPTKKLVKANKKLWNDDNSGKKSRRLTMTRSKSLNENAFALATSARQNIAKVNSQRRNSAPLILVIESAPRKKVVKANKKLSNDGSKLQTLQRRHLRGAQKPVTVTVTVQIERTPRKKPVKRKTKLSNDGDNGKKSHHHKMRR